jgi:ribonuclease D
MATLLDSAAQQDDPGRYYQRIKGAWRLSRDDQYLLQQLAGWRELVARERDRPRGHIVPDAVLAEVARLKPTSRGQLSRIEGFHGRAVRQYGDELLDQLDELLAGASGPAADFETIPEPLSRDARKLLGELRQVIEQRAAELGIAPELLARKRDLELLVRTALAGDPTLPEALCRGWRHEVIGKELLSHV